MPDYGPTDVSRQYKHGPSTLHAMLSPGHPSVALKINSLIRSSKYPDATTMEATPTKTVDRLRAKHVIAGMFIDGRSCFLVGPGFNRGKRKAVLRPPVGDALPLTAQSRCGVPADSERSTDVFCFQRHHISEPSIDCPKSMRDDRRPGHSKTLRAVIFTVRRSR